LQTNLGDGHDGGPACFFVALHKVLDVLKEHVVLEVQHERGDGAQEEDCALTVDQN
jgi:hypothetical protein